MKTYKIILVCGCCIGSYLNSMHFFKRLAIRTLTNNQLNYSKKFKNTVHDLPKISLHEFKEFSQRDIPSVKNDGSQMYVQYLINYTILQHMENGTAPQPWLLNLETLFLNAELNSSAVAKVMQYYKACRIEALGNLVKPEKIDHPCVHGFDEGLCHKNCPPNCDQCACDFD